MKIIKVAGAVADERTITLYDVEGEEHVFDATPHRLKVVVEKIVPALKGGGTVSFDTSDFEVKKGLTRFASLFSGIKLAWERVTDWKGYRGTDERDAQIIAGITTRAEKAAKAPQRSGSGHRYGVEKDERGDHLVAEVAGVKIPGVEHLERHFYHALATKNPQGIENFLKRVAAVIEDRGHSMEELMTFLSRADLPLCDDGSILAYKKVCRKDAGYVDCHTKKIFQRLGSVVEQEYVDPNRRVECAEGFHIGRLDYGFSGDVTLLTKIGPEDVIAVPQGESAKMRVRRYWIVSELPPVGYDLHRRKLTPLTDPTTAKLVGNVIAGRHDLPREIVRKARNGNIDTVPLTDNEKRAFATGKTVGGKPRPAVAVTDAEEKVDPTVNAARALNEAMQAAEPVPPPELAPESTPVAKAPQKALKKPKAAKAATPAKPAKERLSDLPEAHQKAVKGIRAILRKGEAVNKTKVGATFNISPRTVTRLMEKWCK